jgi:outer membrane PBP1 activator LpoA protein
VQAPRLLVLPTLLLVVAAIAGCGSAPPPRSSDRGPAPVRDAGRGGAPAGQAPVAVLLPEDGQFVGAAGAVRDGILAAYYARPAAERPELRFYDAADPYKTVTAIQQAAQAGAGAAIGPLDKAAVAEVAIASLPIPVLALNQAESVTNPAANVYQFALSPEDEARQAADRAWLDGHRAIAAITPAGSWGDRVYASFEARWQALGGQLLAHSQYDAAPNDVAAAVAAAAGSDEARRRQEALQRVIGRTVDAAAEGQAAALPTLFVAGTAPRVRAVRRELRGFGPDTVIYSTSSAWNGDPAAESESGLPAIRIPDMPWLIGGDAASPVGRSAVAAAIPASARSPILRLYAMGIDSLNLLPQLRRLTASGESFDGQTGIITVDGRRQLHRKPVWLELREGQMRVLGFDAAPARKEALPGPAPTSAPPRSTPPPVMPAGGTRI